MKRSERLEKIADINIGFENIAGASLTSAKSEFERQENQLEQLKIYKQEYKNQLEQRLSNAISAKQIQDYQYFFSSLDNAISQQVEIVKKKAADVELSKNNWLDKKQEVAKLDKVSKRIKQQEELAQQQTEQKESDELNLNRYILNQSNKHH